MTGTKVQCSEQGHGSEADLYTTARVEVLRPGATTRSLVMCTIPVDLERRFEQRWAARFVPPVASAAPKKIGPKEEIGPKGMPPCKPPRMMTNWPGRSF